MHDPIIAFISTYREGELVQGAIRSLDRLGCPIVLFEGPTTIVPSNVGRKTDLGVYHGRVNYARAAWKSEADKRNEMLSLARESYKNPFWILTIDADEILLWPEFLPDWLNALKPGYPHSQENVAPLKHTQPGFDEETKNGPATYIAPSRLVHSSLIDHYEIGLLTAITPLNERLDFSVYRSEYPPVFGEPHIHHRYHLRRGERGATKHRGSTLEGKERGKIEASSEAKHSSAG